MQAGWLGSAVCEQAAWSLKPGHPTKLPLALPQCPRATLRSGRHPPMVVSSLLKSSLKGVSCWMAAMSMEEPKHTSRNRPSSCGAGRRVGRGSRGGRGREGTAQAHCAGQTAAAPSGASDRSVRPGPWHAAAARPAGGAHLANLLRRGGPVDVLEGEAGADVKHAPQLPPPARGRRGLEHPARLLRLLQRHARRQQHQMEEAHDGQQYRGQGQGVLEAAHGGHHGQAGTQRGQHAQRHLRIPQLRPAAQGPQLDAAAQAQARGEAKVACRQAHRRQQVSPAGVQPCAAGVAASATVAGSTPAHPAHSPTYDK